MKVVPSELSYGLKTFLYLMEVARADNAVKLNVPETLIFSRNGVICYLFTNMQGCLEVENLNSASSEQSNQIAQETFGEGCTLNKRTVGRLIRIINSWHEQVYASVGERREVIPIAMLKRKSPSNDTLSDLHFLTHGLLSKLMQMHRQDEFICQRFVPSKGFCASVIRCDLTIDRLPHFDPT